MNKLGSMTIAEKTRENRVRMAAQRQHMTLRKHRLRDRMAVGYGKYYLVRAGYTVASHKTLDEIEAGLRDGSWRRVVEDVVRAWEARRAELAGAERPGVAV